MRNTYHLVARITKKNKQRLDELGKQFDMNPSEVVRLLIDNATVVTAPAPGSVLHQPQAAAPSVSAAGGSHAAR